MLLVRTWKCICQKIALFYWNRKISIVECPTDLLWHETACVCLSLRHQQVWGFQSVHSTQQAVMSNKCNLSASYAAMRCFWLSVGFLDGSLWLRFDIRPSITMSRVWRLPNVILRVWEKCFGCEMDALMDCQGRYLSYRWSSLSSSTVKP